MSIAFTLPTVWPNRGQDLAGANELVLAYSERRQVLGQSAVDPLTAGTDGQDKTSWLAMQEWLEGNCALFVDHVNGPLNSDETDFLYFTQETWRAAAGLNENGFRRKVEIADDFSYGKIEKGDLRGDWCFEDLQKGFSALKWDTGPVAPWYEGRGFSSASYLCHARLTDSYELGPAWDVSPIQYGGANGRYTYIYGAATTFRDSAFRFPGNFFVGEWHSNVGDIPYYNFVSRKRVNITFQKVAGLDGSVDIYFRGKSYPNLGVSIPFVDIDGLGLINGGMLYYNTLLTMDNISTGLLGGDDMSYVNEHRGYSCDVLCIRKFNFTNQNA
jgi:hypothetical protein